MEVFSIAKKSNDLLCNEQIRVPHVLVIGPNGEQMGIKPIKDAQTIANYAGLDLVLINANANPAVCKIMDYNKFKYEKAKKAKESRKKQQANNVELKEYRLSPVIDIGDFETKLRNASKYLEKGHKIKLSIRFKGRQIIHPELGEEVMNRFAEKTKDIAVVEQKAKLDGRSMTMLLAPLKEKK
ncbi:MAG: translation initiation factor IF-3 [Bacilli bacterium]